MRAIFWVVLLIACSTNEQSQPQTNFDLLLRPDTQSRAQLPYRDRVHALVDVCCPLEPIRLGDRPPLERAAVCRELQRSVEHGEPALSSPWGPECHEAVPTDSLLLGLRSSKRGDQRVAIAQLLAERDPSEHLQRAMFRELVTLRVPSENPDTLVDTLSLALAMGGEDELKVIAESLHSSDAAERLWATHVLALAMRFPLELPDLRPTLEALTHDPDWRIRERARQATDQPRLWPSTNRDTSAGGVVGIVIPADRATSPYEPFDELTSFRGYRDHARDLLAIKLFAKRRFFCDSKVATTILAMLERTDDLHVSHLAKHASRLRWKRCGRV